MSATFHVSTLHLKPTALLYLIDRHSLTNQFLIALAEGSMFGLRTSHLQFSLLVPFVAIGRVILFLHGLPSFPPMKSSLPQILTLVPIAAQHEASHELMEATCALYGLIHARYVLTTSGLEAMYAKYTLQVVNSKCPTKCPIAIQTPVY